MFTGIIKAIGSLRSARPVGGDMRLVIDAGGLDLSRVARGDSIAVSGVCLTVVEQGADWFAADVSRETLATTTLGGLGEGARVNLEQALAAGQQLGGHLVTGHVDGIGECIARRPEARSVRLEFRIPAALSRYVARKGSVCIDGVSLTVNGVAGQCFDVNIVPHTLEATVIGEYRPGVPVNIEVDIIARYLERLMQAREDPGIDRAKLEAYGYAAD